MIRSFLVLNFVLAQMAWAQCPARGEVDANRASADVLMRMGLPAEVARTITNTAQAGNLQGFGDLKQIVDRADLEVPEALVVCPSAASQRSSANDRVEVEGDRSIGEGDSRTERVVHVNSHDPASLQRLAACGVDVAALASKNIGAVSFPTANDFRRYMRRNCQGLPFRISVNGRVERL